MRGMPQTQGSHGKPTNMSISTAVIQLVKQASCHTFHPPALRFSETETLFMFYIYIIYSYF